MIHRPYAVFSERIGIKKIVSIRVGVGIVELSGKDFDFYPLGCGKFEEIWIFHPDRKGCIPLHLLFTIHAVIIKVDDSFFREGNDFVLVRFGSFLSRGG